MVERRRLRVYVAGPITQGDVFENVTNAVRVGKRMVKDGLAPFIPHLDAYMFAGSDISWNAYLEWDFEWASLAEAMYRLDGPSAGSDKEVEMANRMGIPVFYAEDCCGTEHDVAYDDLLYYAAERNLLGVRR